MFKITLDEKNDCKWEVSRNRHIAKYLVVAMESPPSIGDLIPNAKLHCDVVTTFAKIAEYAVTTWILIFNLSPSGIFQSRLTHCLSLAHSRLSTFSVHFPTHSIMVYMFSTDSGSDFIHPSMNPSTDA